MPPPPLAPAKFDPAVDPVLGSPFEEPSQHWSLDKAGRATAATAPQPGRRPSGLLDPVPPDHKTAHEQLELSGLHRNRLINDIRRQVAEWRRGGYRGATSVSQRLLGHWADERACRLRPFFAQREAIETLIWLREVATRAAPQRRELERLSRQHNDELVRHAVKMATGTGKTAVMGMLIAWQTLNAARTTRRRNLMHGQRFLVLTPGVTIRDRLAELKPSSPTNVYDEMGLAPAELRDTLNRARVEIVNFQAFTRQDLNTLGFPRSGAKGGRAHRDLIGRRSGDGDDGRESYEQSAQRVLKTLLASGSGPAGAYGDLVVINDEAHHCYLPATGTGGSGARRSKADAKEDQRAAVWFNVLRSLRSLGELGRASETGQASVVYDFSATPMWIDTSARTTPKPFEWVASDFSLMDAIESGLVKVPRVPVDDDSSADRTVWRNLYDHSAAKKIPKPSTDGPASEIPAPLRNALDAQYDDYRSYLDKWQQVRPETCPALIVVANSIENADALYEHIAGWAEDTDNADRRGSAPQADRAATAGGAEDTDNADGGGPRLHPGRYRELSNVVNGRWADEPRTLLVHSELDDPGEISARAKNLLKQQGSRIAGRRGRSADALEAVREVLNTVGKEGRPGARIRCVISVGMLTEGWDARTVTHIVGYRAFSTQLLCEQVTGRALRRSSYEDFRGDGSGRLAPEYAEVVGIPFEFMPSVGDKTVAAPEPRPRTHVHTAPGRAGRRITWPRVREYRHVSRSRRLLLDDSKVKPFEPRLLTASTTLLQPVAGATKIIAAEARLGEARFRLAAEMVDEFQSTHPDRQGSRAELFRSARQIIERWLDHPQVRCPRPAELLADDSDRVRAVADILGACTDEHARTPRRVAILDAPATADTSDVDFWTTLTHVHATRNSELSHAACHSRLEQQVAQVLDTCEHLECWARNFQTGWAVPYHFGGAWRRYEPDFVARLAGNGTNLIIECKGVRDDKADAAEAYVRDHWIPCVAGTPSLPGALRRWDYLVITDAAEARAQITEAARRASTGDGTRPAAAAQHTDTIHAAPTAHITEPAQPANTAQIAQGT